MFRYENKFNRIMTYIFDFIMLNTLFLVMSIPIVTIGANLTAMYTVGFQLAQKNESSVYKIYMQSFKENFKQATISWIILFTLIIILSFNLHLLGQISGVPRIWGILTTLFFLLALIYIQFLFPLIAKMKGSLYIQMKNVFLISVGYLPYSLLQLGITFAPMLIIYKWFPQYYMIGIYFYFFIGIAITMLVNARIFQYVFEKLIRTKERMETETV